MCVMLTTLAHGYHELYAHVTSYLSPRCTYVLSMVCAALHACACDRARHYAIAMPYLRAIGRIRYRVMNHSYRYRIEGYAIARGDTESVRDGVVYFTTELINHDDNVGPYRTAMHLAIYASSRGPNIAYVPHARAARIVESWSAYYAMSTRRLQLCHIIVHGELRECILRTLSDRDKRALANTDYATFARKLYMYAAVRHTRRDQ